MYLLFLLLFILILFISIPIKFQALYIDNDFKVYIYNKLIFSLVKFKNKKFNQNEKINKDSNKNINKKKKHKKVSLDINALFLCIYRNRFKPKLFLNLDLEYSLDDAADTAIVYGTINSLLGTIFNTLNICFNLKSLDSNITPLFNNMTTFKINIKGIIYINLAKIIYMFFLYLKEKTTKL